MAHLGADEDMRSLFNLLGKGGCRQEVNGEEAISVDAVDGGLQELGFKSTAADKSIGRLRAALLSSARGRLTYDDFRGACLPLLVGPLLGEPSKNSGPLNSRLLLVFCGHDPGAVSHTHPLFALACSDSGVRAVYIPLRNGSQPWGGPSAARAVLERVMGFGAVGAVITGCSTCKAELDVTEECNRVGIPCCTVVDWNPSARLEPAAHSDPGLCLASMYVVTNLSAAGELAERYSVDPKTVHICGSPALEHTANSSQPRLERHQVRTAYGAERSQRLVSFFPGTMEDSSGWPVAISAVFDALAGSFSPEGWLVVVRVHPRTSEPTLQSIADCSRRHGFLLDHRAGGRGGPGQQVVDSVSLLKASDVSLSVGSSMSLESLAMGTPSAFFFSGLEDRGAHKETYVASLPVTRLYAPAHVEAFLDLALHWDLRGRPANVLNCQGAAARALEAIKSLGESEGPTCS